MTELLSASVIDLNYDDDGNAIERDEKQIAETAFSMLLSGGNLSKICDMLQYLPGEEKLLELVKQVMEREVNVYKEIYRAQDILKLNNWLDQIEESLRSSSSKLKPALISAGLRVLETRTKLLNEMTGLTKPGLTINYSIEGVDLSQI